MLLQKCGKMALTVLLACLAATLCAGEAREHNGERKEGVALTVYRDSEGVQRAKLSGNSQYYDPALRRYVDYIPGWGVVKVRRKMELKKGLNVVRFTDVAASIDPTTVLVTSLTDPKHTFVQEQNFEYDLVNPDKILRKYVDRTISVATKGGEVHGTLLSFDAENLVLKTGAPAQPIRIIARSDNVRELRFSKLPGGLITRPTLVWHLIAKKKGEHLIQATYHTGNMTWKADYTATISAKESSIDLAAWVTLDNRSGTAYPGAHLKLVAGDVHRVLPNAWRYGGGAFGNAFGRASSLGARPQFKERSFFEYHLYTLGRPTTLADNSKKQIELFPPVSGIPVRKRFVYYGGRGMFNYPYYRSNGPNQDRNFGLSTNTKVDIYLEFKNEKKAGLGIPLPAGRVRVYKRDPADKALEFIGEDEIDHTPKDEAVRLRMGSAFDVTAERRQTQFTVNYNEHWITESFEIKVRNHKKKDVRVDVQEDMYRWVNWKIEKASHEYKKASSQRVIFPLKVKSDAETVLTYTVHYTW